MSAYSVKGDPYWLTARYPSQCAGCGQAFGKGARIFYWPKGKRCECASCGETSERRFLAEVQDEIMSGGWS